MKFKHRDLKIEKETDFTLPRKPFYGLIVHASGYNNCSPSMNTSKANKACVPCRARKVKCDAAVIGLPCSSCTGRQCPEDCVLPVRKGRTRLVDYYMLRGRCVLTYAAHRKVIHVLPTPSNVCFITVDRL